MPQHSARPIRPYVLTQGRTRVRGLELPLETTVLSIVDAPATVGGAHPELVTIVRLCARPRSIAEIAARTGMPLGVARVLVADLVIQGAVTTGAVAPTEPDDRVRVLERLLDGVRAL